jgi:aminomethyltransferase
MSKPSPFEPVHLLLGAKMKSYHGWRLPAHYESVDAEQQALEQHCAAFDLCGFGRVSIKGPDAAKVLQAMGATDIPLQSSQRWNWTKNGKQTCRVAALRNEYIIFSVPGHEVLEKVRKAAAHEKSDVQITDLAEKTAFLGLYGPKAFDSMSKLLPFEIDELTPGAAMPISVFMMNFILLRGSWLGTDGLELICPVSAAGLVGASIAKYRQKYNITPAGMECLLNAMEKAPVPDSLG